MRTLVLEEVEMLGEKKRQLAPFLQIVLLVWAAVMLFLMLFMGVFLLTDVLSLYGFV